ncbi:hypothetical protein U1Q18_020600 [Sarracenia purpurea var. burkii]
MVCSSELLLCPDPSEHPSGWNCPVIRDRTRTKRAWYSFAIALADSSLIGLHNRKLRIQSLEAKPSQTIAKPSPGNAPAWARHIQILETNSFHNADIPSRSSLQDSASK